MFIYSEDLKNFNEIFRKDVAYDNIKSHTFFELTPPPSLSPPIYLNINHSFLSKWLRFTYFLSENHREFDFFVIAREISKSDFFVTFCKRQSKVTL